MHAAVAVDVAQHFAEELAKRLGDEQAVASAERFVAALEAFLRAQGFTTAD